MSHIYRNYIFQPQYPFDPEGVVHDTSLYSYCYKHLNPLGSRIFVVSSLCYKYLNPSGSLMVGNSSAIIIPIEQIFFFELNLKFLEEINIFFFKCSLSMMLFTSFPFYLFNFFRSLSKFSIKCISTGES